MYKSQNLFTSLIILFIFLVSCVSRKPTGLTYSYNRNMNVGLDSLIDLDGYYLSTRECDSTFFSAFVFYPDGLFSIATGSDLSEIEKCFFNDEKTILCQNLSWGLYRIQHDTIKTQTIRQEEMEYCIIYRDYVITQNKSLINISDYVKSNLTNIGYMRNYPSFTDNSCATESKFKRTKKAKRNKSLCPYINKKWFVEEKNQPEK